MSADHATTIERLNQAQQTRAASTVDRVQEAQERDAVGRGTFTAGVRVLDRVTGLEGVVGPMPTTFVVSSVLVPVRLTRGDLVLRPPSQLMWRPTPPTA